MCSFGISMSFAPLGFLLSVHEQGTTGSFLTEEVQEPNKLEKTAFTLWEHAH